MEKIDSNFKLYHKKTINIELLKNNKVHQTYVRNSSIFHNKFEEGDLKIVDTMNSRAYYIFKDNSFKLIMTHKRIWYPETKIVDELVR